MWEIIGNDKVDILRHIDLHRLIQRVVFLNLLNWLNVLLSFLPYIIIITIFIAPWDLDSILLSRLHCSYQYRIRLCYPLYPIQSSCILTLHYISYVSPFLHVWLFFFQVTVSSSAPILYLPIHTPPNISDSYESIKTTQQPEQHAHDETAQVSNSARLSHN
jgi:hypothetical protein